MTETYDTGTCDYIRLDPRRCTRCGCVLRPEEEELCCVCEEWFSEEEIEEECVA